MNKGRIIKITKKKGFFGKGEKILINDEKGLPFYNYKPAGKTIKFNLPAGIYTLVEGQISPISGVHSYTNPPLKLPAPRFKVPRRIHVEYKRNPNKATINLITGVVTMDNSFLDMPKFIRIYVLFHEIGHYFYKGEEGADRFAQVEMLRRGYNPSQIHQASEFTLSHHASERKGKTKKYLQKAK